MMSTGVDSSAMENSTFLREIADFDIKAPISVTICFEDDFDEKPIKTEIETDDYQKEAQVTDNSAFVPILEPKKEAQVDTFLDTVHQPEPKNDKTYSDAPRKRNTDDLQPCTSSPKKGKHGMGVENNYDKENSVHMFTSHVNNSDEQIDSNLSTRKKSDDNLAINSVDAPLNAASSLDQVNHSTHVNGLHQNQIDKINVYITNCLATVSENMRRIMEAYDLHQQHKITKETFKVIKFRHFNSSFKTVLTILLPEEKNSEFIQTFLNDTVQRASKAAALNHVRQYQDYANLLFEMLMWTRQTKHQFSQASQNKTVNPLTSSAGENITKSGLEHSVQGAQHSNTEVNNPDVNRNADKVCIFASGPPGREFSINIDPVKYLKVTCQDGNAEPKSVQQSSMISDKHPQKMQNATNQMKATVMSPTEFSAKCHNNLNKITQQPMTQAGVSQMCNQAATQLQQHSELPNHATSFMSLVPPNYSIATQQTHGRAPLLETQLAMPHVPPLSGQSQVLQPQQQQQQSRPPPPSYGILPHQLAQYDQSRHSKAQFGQHLQTSPQYGQTHLRNTQEIPLCCSQSRQSEARSKQKQPTQPQYNRAQLLQMQKTSMQYQSGHLFSQSGQTLQHDVSDNLQLLQPFAQYRQTKESQMGFLPQEPQLCRQQLNLRPSERFPSMTALLSLDSMLPPTTALTNEQPQAGPWEHVRPQNGQLKYVNNLKFGSWDHLYQNPDTQQVQPRPANQTEWHKEINAVHQVGVPPQTHKGSPRAASTDSGFISPLNFNVSTDQTIPATPQEPETFLPLITHVTSLSEKAAFIEYGNCTVCKKTTKQMCMGCMKIYYCTYKCQSEDWARHVSSCAQQTTNYGSAQRS